MKNFVWIFCAFFALCGACSTPGPGDLHAADPTDVQTQSSDHTQTVLPAEGVEKPLVQSEPPVIPELPQCFTEIESVTGEIYPSSLILGAWKNGHLLAFDSGDSAQLWFLNQDGLLEKLAENPASQVACIETRGDSVRLAVVERDAKSGEFAVVVRAYDDKNSDLSRETWKVTNRGFEPAPSGRCVILGNREMLVTGSRPRKDRAPYRGMFHVEPKKLIQITENSEHLPEIVAWHQPEILTREVVRDENDKLQWPHVLYRYGANGDLTEISRADFIVRSGDRWVRVNRSGCILDGDEMRCPDREIEINRVIPLPGFCSDALCMEWFSEKRAWFVRVAGGDNPEIVEIPKNYQILPMPLSDDRWLAIELDEQKPDFGTGVKIVQPDRNCLNIP